MNVLVTGGAGMIGGYVVAELVRSGHEVTAMDRAQPREPVSGARYRIANHEDLGEVVALCPGMDAIVHLSAIPTPRTYPDTLVFRTNVMGTYNVHEAAVIAGVPLVVSTSSQSAYGFAWKHRPFYPQYLPLDEEHPDLSQDAYGLSKMVGEQIAHAYHRRCDLRVCCIRPPLVVKPELYETLIKHLIATPESWSDTFLVYVDVRDLAVAYRMVLEAPASLIQDEVFNVVADDALATEPLAELLPRIDPTIGALAAGLTGRQGMISGERIRQKLGWKPAYSWRDVLTEG
jgi:nucleoside-diphosphate-sugar epimerase